MFQGKAVPGYFLLAVGLALIRFVGGSGGVVLGLLIAAAGIYLLRSAYNKGW